MTERNNGQLSDVEKAEVRGFRTGRLMGLTDVWTRLRDAPEGPMMDAMKIVMEMMEEMETSGNQGPGD
jgi:hypothetical protein